MAELSYYGVGNQSNWNTPIEPERPVSQTPLIPPELQSIIDKVSSSSPMRKGQRQALVGLAGQIGGLEQQRRSEEGTTQRFGITEASKASEFGVTSQLEKEKLGQVERGWGIEQQRVDLEKAGVPDWLQKVIMKRFGLAGTTPVGTSGSPISTDISSKGMGGYSGKSTSSLIPEEYDKWLSNF